MRTRNGAITGYVKIRAKGASEAARKAVQKAPEHLSEGRYPVEEWICIGVSLHEEDTRDVSNSQPW